MPDEGQPVELSIAIAALTALAPAWFRHEPDLFVVADGLNLRSGPSCQIAYREHAPPHVNIQPLSVLRIGSAMIQASSGAHGGPLPATGQIRVEPQPERTRN